jgi:ClpP class serine protease
MGPAFNFSDAMSKYGVAALTLTEGKDKDELNPFRPWKPNEAASLQDIMASLYDRFVSIVAAARPMLTQEKLVNDYGAHVFISQKAAELGYIDFGNSNYADALTGLATAAQIEGNQKYQVVRLSVQHTLADLFSQSISPQRILQALGVTSPAQHPELSGKILYLYQP